ncbi:MAG: hypothetical protein CMJ78_05925 [Planctomycetaceae bacterium]|nr:hypothetical protein [Planctomycetaceae bacterium]
MSKHLWNDELGAVISAELTVILSVGVLSLVVGLSELSVAVNTEMNDLSNAFGALIQTFATPGFGGAPPNNKKNATFIGTTFNDQVDDCDTNLATDLVTGAPTTPAAG